MKADHGNSHAQARLDIGQTTSQKFSPAGPLKFPACYKGTVGYVYIITDAISPYIEWKSYNKSSKTSWTIQIRDIHDLSKVDGMSFKTGQVVRWALDKEAVDGLVVTTSGGERFHLSAVVKRNEVFNRLIALGNQTWEVY